MADAGPVRTPSVVEIPSSRMAFLDQFTVVLLDLNGTFMFGADRFAPTDDFAATYAQLGGGTLPADRVDDLIRRCHGALAAHYDDPARFDAFPQVADIVFALAPELSFAERERLEQVFALHELGTVPDEFVAALHGLYESHALGLVSNIWSRKTLWVSELRRAGVRDLFSWSIFSSDYGVVKPSLGLFALALEAFEVLPADVVFVGDSLERDVLPAKDVGMATVWVDPAQRAHPAADTVVPDLLALLR